MKESKPSCETLVRLEELEEALLRSEELYRSLLESTGAAVVRVDRHGKRTFVSQQTVELAHRSVEDLLAGSFGDMMAPEDRERALAAVKQVFATGRPVTGLTVRQVRDGEDTYVSGNYMPVRDRKGNVVEVQVTTTDVTALKRAAEAVRFSGELYRSLVNATGSSVVRVDRDGRRTFVKEAILDRSAGNMYTGVFGDSLFPEDRERAWEVLRSVFETGKPVQGFTARGVWNGKEVYVISNYEPVRDPGGNVVEVQVTTNDITELKKVEEALKESQQDLNRAQAVAQTGSWRLDVRHNELLWSDESHRIFGIPKGTPITYETFLSCVHPEDRDHVNDSWNAALQGEKYDIEHRIVVGDEVKWVRERAELEFDQEGMLQGGFGTAQDITERKQAEEALHLSEELYRSVADVDGNAIIRVDRTGKRTFVSRYSAKMRGLTIAEMLDEPFGAAVAPEDKAKAWQALREVFDTGRGISGLVTRQEWSWAGERYMSTTYSPVKDAQGNVVEVQVTSYDITEQKRLENELREADRMKDQFLSDIAHELQTPVTTAKMSLGFMSNLMGDLQNERAQKLMVNAVASIEQLEKLVKDLLDLARLQNRRLELRRETIDVSGLLNKVMDRHSPIFAQKEIAFTLDGCPAALVYADSQRVQEVLDNLLSNAYKYTGRGGAVTVSSRPEDDHVVVSVADTGPGISLEDRARLFRRFERVVSEGQAGGIGLGLAISRGIVELHGGRIWVESDVGRGSTFRFSLPRGAESAGEGI